MSEKFKLLKHLLSFVDVLHSKEKVFNEFDPLIKEVLVLKEEYQNLNPRVSYDDKLIFIHKEEQIKSKLQIIDDNVFKPLEKELLELNIFRHIYRDKLEIKISSELREKEIKGESNDKKSIDKHSLESSAVLLWDDYDLDTVYRKHYKYRLEMVYINAIKKSSIIEDTEFLPEFKNKIKRYIEFRTNTVLISSKLSDMLLCFDLLVNKLQWSFNLDSNFEKIMTKPYFVIKRLYFRAEIFYPHVIKKDELEDRVKDLIESTEIELRFERFVNSEMEYNSEPYKFAKTNLRLMKEDDILILKRVLNDDFLKHTRNNFSTYNEVEKEHFIYDFLDLIDILKENIKSRKGKKFLDDFAIKLKELEKPKQIRESKSKVKVEFKDFFKKLDSKKINRIESKFMNLHGINLAIFINLSYKKYKILDVIPGNKSGYSVKDFVSFFSENENYQSVNKYLDSYIGFKGDLNDLEPIENQLHSILK